MFASGYSAPAAAPRAQKLPSDCNQQLWAAIWRGSPWYGKSLAADVSVISEDLEGGIIAPLLSSWGQAACKTPVISTSSWELPKLRAAVFFSWLCKEAHRLGAKEYPSQSTQQRSQLEPAENEVAFLLFSWGILYKLLLQIGRTPRACSSKPQPHCRRVQLPRLCCPGEERFQMSIHHSVSSGERAELEEVQIESKNNKSHHKPLWHVPAVGEWLILA